jgi:hypothetical protein
VYVCVTELGKMQSRYREVSSRMDCMNTMGVKETNVLGYYALLKKHHLS